MLQEGHFSDLFERYGPLNVFVRLSLSVVDALYVGYTLAEGANRGVGLDLGRRTGGFELNPVAINCAIVPQR